jgi:ABC-type transport system involved in cytochrome c biogenesis permease subunit
MRKCEVVFARALKHGTNALSWQNKFCENTGRLIPMLNSVILSYITFVYFCSFMLYLMMMVMGKSLLGRLATIITTAGLAVHTFALGLRWVESYRLGIGHAPLSNLYESLIFFAWTIILLYIIMERRTRNKSVGAFATPLAFLAMAYLLKRLDRPERSNGFLRLIPGTAILDDLSYQMVVIGFLLLTLGIITGAVWAHAAWGSYWTWDPKETWSLITWLVYAAFLHSRMIRGWRGKKLAVLSIVGFSCVLFTYFGVNYLAGLHSYAQS